MLKNNKKVLLYVLLSIVLVGLFVLVNIQFTFGFFALFIFLLLFVLIPFLFKERKTKKEIDEVTRQETIVPVRNASGGPAFNNSLSVRCAFIIIVFGGLALFTLSNYFNANPAIYKNYQHHALRIDGIKIKGLPFDLAGADSDSFIDNPTISGKIRVESYDNNGVQLSLSGVTNPVYKKHYSKKYDPYLYTCLDSTSANLIRFDASDTDSGDWVTLTGKEPDRNGGFRQIRFKVIEKHDKGFLNLDYLWTKDSLICVFQEPGSAPDTSSFHAFIKNSYALEDIASDIHSDFNFSGINIVRSLVSLKTKNRDIHRKYGDKKRHYYIEVQKNSSLNSVQVGSKEVVSIGDLREISTSTVFVPYDSSIFVGSGKYKSESVKFARQGKDSCLVLLYELPKYKSLSSNESAAESTIMVTSTIVNPNQSGDGDSGLIDNLTDNVLQFDLFHNDGNSFHIRPFFISYIAGATNERMEFSVLSDASPTTHYGVTPGTYFQEIHSRNGTEWLVQVENFKDTTPFKATTLSWLLLLIIVLCAWSMYFSQFARLYTHFEYAAYLLIIGFLSIRFFLMWRTTVFPPVSSISLYEFRHFRDSLWLRVVVIYVLAFLAGVNLLKYTLYLSVRKDEQRRLVRWAFNIRMSITNWINRIRKVSPAKLSIEFVIAILLVYIAIGIMAKLNSRPFICVLIPACVFIIFDALIYMFLGSSFSDDLNRHKEKQPVGERAYAFLVSTWNLLLTCAVTLFADGGYGVMFTMFMIFALWLKVFDLFQYTRYYKRNRKLITILMWSLSFILLFIVAKFKTIFISLFDAILQNEAWVFFTLAALAVLIIAGVIYVILNIKPKVWHSIFVLAVILVAVVGSVISSNIRGSHMEYRTRVHMENAGEILYNIDTPSAQDKFLQASLNDWILSEYQEIGKSVHGIGEHGNGYFKMQPQSKLGAKWFAQTTDICLSRFVIAEHGTGLAFLFVITFALLLLVGLRGKFNKRWEMFLCVQVALLLSVQSLMIFLANTRAFIFFGQDFPLLSITSRLSTMYFFILLFLAMAGALMGKFDFNFDFYDKLSEEIKVIDKNKSVSRVIIVAFLLCALVLSPIKNDINRGHFNQKAKRTGLITAGNKSIDLHQVAFYKDRKYDVDTLLTLVNAEFDTWINPAFIEYQKTHGVPKLQRNMSSYIDQVFSDSSMVVAYKNCTPFTQKMLDNYKSRGSKSNSINNLVCLRNTITYEYKRKNAGKRVIQHDTLELVTTQTMYKYELPQKVKDSWKGNVVEAINGVLPNSAFVTYSRNYSCAYIPSKYTGSGEPVQLVKNTGDAPLKLIGSDALLSIQRDAISVVNLSKSDFLISGNKIVENTPLQRYKYIARNLLLNGKRTFVYPNGKSMFWARDVAAFASRNKGPEDGDVIISINSELTNALYNSYASNVKEGGDRTVIVADGDGMIRAMVDYRKDREYRLNPNDFKRIGQVSDSLYLNREKGRSTESRYFGNFAQNYLRCGPGSSQKPILWSAVTSMYNTGWWSSLELAGIRTIKLDVSLDGSNEYTNAIGGDFIFPKFAGQRIETKFRSLQGDEGAGNNVALQFYMYKSSNYYNALMAYIGTYRSSDLDSDGFLDIHKNRDGNTLLFRPSIPYEPARQKKQSDEEYKKTYIKYFDSYCSLFPLMEIGGRTVAFNKFIEKGRVMDTLALVPRGLKVNFGLPQIVSYGQGNPYSHFNMAVRKDWQNNRFRDSTRELNEYMVRSVAIGSNTVWNVSPSKMAEMYGRLITMNKSYSLSLFADTPKKQYKRFDLHDSWKHGYDDYIKVRKDLLKGMSLVYSKGTAKKIGIINEEYGTSKLVVDDGNGRQNGKPVKNRLYVYGKTGTIDGFWGKEKAKDHLLATIITDREISTCPEKELEDVKFYVIYQADYQYQTPWEEVDKGILQTVLNSKAFKEYMGINK